MTAELHAAFAPPTLELVEHALRDLAYHERFVGYAMTASAGNAPKDMYSLRDAVLFLVGTRWDAPMLHSGFKGALNWVDVDSLSAWLRNVVGDADLADAMQERASGLASFREQSEAIGKLVSARMVQYREVYDAAHAADDTSPEADA